MKMRRLKKLTAVILTIIMLSSCAPLANKGSGSSNIANGEGNKPSISSAASIETNSEMVSSSPKKEENSEKEEQNTSKQPSTDKENVSSEVKRPITPGRPSSNSEDEDEPSSNTSVSSEPEKELSLEDFMKLELNKRKCVMPPDNPPPVTVHREDAHIPVPASFTHILQDGEDVEFNAYRSDSGVPYIDRYICIFDSYEKFMGKFGSSDLKYDEAFFDDNTLIIIYVEEGSTPSNHEIRSVTQKDGQMCISLKHIDTGVGYAEDYGKVIIEVSKQDLKDIENIVLFEEKRSYLNRNGEREYETRILRRNPVVEV